MLPALWPEPAVWTDVGELMLLVFTQDGVPTWEVGRRAKLTRAYDRRANQLQRGAWVEAEPRQKNRELYSIWGAPARL